MSKEYSFSSMGFNNPLSTLSGNDLEIKGVRLKGTERILTFAQMERYAEEVRLLHAQLQEEEVTFL